MDEMSIKSGLVFNKHSGEMVGFVDLGGVNRDIELVMNGGDICRKLATQTLVFMARCVFKPSLSIPVAHYFSSHIKGIIIMAEYVRVRVYLHDIVGEKIFPLAWDVVEALELYNIPVVSFTSDGAKPNRRFYRICQIKQKGSRRKLPYQATNPYNRDRNLYFFCDVPHLLKTARNCFSNSFSHSCSRKMKV